MAVTVPRAYVTAPSDVNAEQLLGKRVKKRNEAVFVTTWRVILVFVSRPNVTFSVLFLKNTATQTTLKKNAGVKLDFWGQIAAFTVRPRPAPHSVSWAKLISFARVGQLAASSNVESM